MNQGIDALQNEVPSVQQEFLNSYDHQVTLPTISVPVPSEQPVMDSGLTVGGYNDDMATRFSMHPQNGNLNTPFPFDATSLPSQNPMVHTSQQIQVPGSDNLLAFGPRQTSAPGFQSFGSSNLNSYKGTEDFFSEDEIRTRSHEMLENDDMQHLLRIFNMGGQGLSSFNATEDGYPFSSTNMPTAPPNYSFGSAKTNGQLLLFPSNIRIIVGTSDEVGRNKNLNSGRNSYVVCELMKSLHVSEEMERALGKLGPAKLTGQFSILSQNGNLNISFHFYATSLSFQDPLVTNNLLALGPPPSPSLGSQGNAYRRQRPSSQFSCGMTQARGSPVTWHFCEEEGCREASTTLS
ncbi:hypothetical protein POTOM_015020 [Populus tomentosa]|uniref:Uncharacterized protein n=1 Tax=Populus tomentosa TaxID=118781 RepID=A0A8X7ZWW0_POPTO|nr:hypothetical protein POTOM_015020 [Populus tomentosa]